MRTQLYRAAWFFLAAFGALMLYLGYFIIIKGPDYQANPRNPRSALWEKAVVRGGILDQNGEILATNVDGHRSYPKGEATAPVIGYLSDRYGYSGLEAAANSWLVGLTGREAVFNKLRRLMGMGGHGYDLILSLDSNLQTQAMDLLGGRRGAIVVMDPNNGRVLALASSPSFDPEEIDSNWKELSNDRNAPLINRALNGLYPPGSVNKIYTGAAALSASPEWSKREYYCPGHIDIQGRRLHCQRAHGQVNLQRALQYSCNVGMASLALDVGGQQMAVAAEAMGYNRKVPFELPVSNSSFPVGSLDSNALAESAIGQGKVLATPFFIALLTSAVANGGVVPEPHLIDSVRDSSGRVTALPHRSQWLTAFPGSVANELARDMEIVVDQGTGSAASLPGVRVAGKTGSAENPHGEAHAWFTCYAPVEAPSVVVTVVVENSGSGGGVAAPLARQLLETALAGQKKVK